MASEQVQIVVSATDNASAALKTIQGNVDKFQTGFTGAMKAAAPASQAFGVALLGITAGVTAFGVSAVKAYNDAEASQKMLEHAVINVSHATQAQLAQTMALSDALEKKGVLDGDNIKMGLAQLSTFGLSNKAVQALGGSLADLAVNQFGVNASGEQLSDTANMIAKALNGQFGVLEKSGIRFTDLQQKVIMTGTEMEKVNAINQGFAQNLKFTNEVARQTGEGLQAHVAVQLGNIQEAIGQAITAGINPLIEKFSKWLDAIGGVDGVMKMLMGTLGTLKDYLPLIVTTIAVILMPAFVALGASIWTATAPILPFVAAGLALGAMVQLVVGYFGGFNGVMTALQPILQIGQALFAQVWEEVQKLWQALTELWNLVSPVVIPMLQMLGGIIGGILLTAIFAAIESIKLIIAILTVVTQTITAVISKVAEWVGSLNGLKTNIVNFWTTLIAKTGEAGALITVTVKTLWDAISGIFTVAIQGIIDLLTLDFNILTGLFKLFGKILTGDWQGVWDMVKGVVTSTWDAVKTSTDNALGYITRAVNTIQSMMSSIKGAIGQVGNAIGGGISSAGKALGFASGGIVPGPLGAAQLAVVHGGEQFIPAASMRMAGAGAGGGGIVINISGNTISSDLDMRDLAQRVGDAVMSNLRSNIRF